MYRPKNMIMMSVMEYLAHIGQKTNMSSGWDHMIRVLQYVLQHVLQYSHLASL